MEVPQTIPQNKVIAVQPVSLALVSYVDERGATVTQLAVVGENNVNLLESRSLGITQSTTPKGPASSWLTKGVLKYLKKGK